MGDPHKIHDAIRTKLVNDAGLVALIGSRVYNLSRPGTAAVYPLLTFGEVGDPRPTDGGIQQMDYLFWIWTAKRDQIGASQIAKALAACLDGIGVAATGWTVENIVRRGGGLVETRDDDVVHWKDEYTIFAY